MGLVSARCRGCDWANGNTNVTLCPVALLDTPCVHTVSWAVRQVNASTGYSNLATTSRVVEYSCCEVHTNWPFRDRTWVSETHCRIWSSMFRDRRHRGHLCRYLWCREHLQGGGGGRASEEGKTFSIGWFYYRLYTIGRLQERKEWVWLTCILRCTKPRSSEHHASILWVVITLLDDWDHKLCSYSTGQKSITGFARETRTKTGL